MTKPEIDALIERVKGLSGPDRWVNRDIWQALDTPEWRHAYIRAQEPCGCPHDQAVEYAARYLPDVTASIDAALALVERVLPGWAVTVATYHTDYGSPYADMGSRRYIEGDDGYEHEYAEAPGATPPLAIILALLTAIRNREHGHDKA